MNSIKNFLFTELNIRGQHIQLDDAWQAMLKNRHYPAPLITMLGELTAITVMLASGLKHAGKVTIQVQGTGPVNLLVVEATHDLKIRGVAKTKADAKISEQHDTDDLLGDGKILVTLENTLTNSHFQSYVPREATNSQNSIAQSFENFLTQSDQQPSKLWLAANEHGLGGVLIQKMPLSENIDADGWERVKVLSNTLSTEEIIQLDSETLIHRLFNEELVKLFEGKEIQYHCPKDFSRVENMLLSLGKEEAQKIIDEQGEIVVHNEMCNFHARYNQTDIDKLFKETLNN